MNGYDFYGYDRIDLREVERRQAAERAQREALQRQEFDRQRQAVERERQKMSPININYQDLTNPPSIRDREARGELKAETLETCWSDRALAQRLLDAKARAENNPNVVGDPIEGVGGALHPETLKDVLNNAAEIADHFSRSKRDQ
jgi:hypothetical protein